MFLQATAFSQELCWDVSGKTVTNMFDGTNGATTVVCSPSSSPSGLPTIVPTSQPSRDASFKKHFQNECENVREVVRDGFQEAQGGLQMALKRLRAAIGPK